MKIHTYRAYRRFARNERSQPRDALAEGDIRKSFFFNFYIYFFIFLFFYFSPTYHRSQRYQRYQKLILAPKQKKKKKKSRGERINLASTRENFCHFRQFSSHPNEKRKKTSCLISHTRFFSIALYVFTYSIHWYQRQRYLFVLEISNVSSSNFCERGSRH